MPGEAGRRSCGQRRCRSRSSIQRRGRSRSPYQCRLRSRSPAQRRRTRSSGEGRASSAMAERTAAPAHTCDMEDENKRLKNLQAFWNKELHKRALQKLVRKRRHQRRAAANSQQPRDADHSAQGKKTTQVADVNSLCKGAGFGCVWKRVCNC